MKRRKLLSFLLALVMALSLAVPAFADETNPPKKELRFAWIFTDEENKWFAEDTVLNDKDKPFEGGLGMNPAGDCFMIFFIWNNEKGQREKFVVPEGDGNITVTRLSADEIAKDAQQTQYYVRLHMDEFKDGEVTADGLSFHVSAMLDDFGFYSAETASAETVLGSDVAAADLTDYTLYFQDIYVGTDEADQHDTVTKVEKNPDMGDPNKFFDLENVKDGLWKITINDVGKTALKNGGFPVNLNLEVKNPQGETRQGWRNIFIAGENVNQGPQLIFADLAGEWDDDAGHDLFFVNRDYGGQVGRMQAHAGYERTGIFGTVKDGEDPFTDHGLNWDAFTPVDVKNIIVSDGLTLESLTDQAKKGEDWSKYFVKVSVAENGKEYTVTSGDYTMIVDSGLPEVGVYTAPEASFDTWAGEYEYPYHPAKADNTYYIISTAADDDGMNNRHLTEVKLSTKDLPEDCGNTLVGLDKVSDNVYKLTIKDTSRNRFHVELDLTWTDFMGNTWTDEHWGFGDFYLASSIVASETKLTDKYNESLPYSEIEGKVSTGLTMTVGEQKLVYLYVTPRSQDGLMYRAFDAVNAANYRSSDGALTFSFDKADPARFTLSATKAGTYEVWMGGKDWDYENIKFTHADGTPYTEEEKTAVYEDDSFYWDIDDNGTILVWDADQPSSEAVPFEEYFDGDTYEVGLLSQELIDYGWQHLTVTVTGEAKTFPDVKAGDWFEKAVQYVYDKGLMKGTDKGFEPSREVYNTEMIQILWNLAGKPEAEATVSGAEGQWYAGVVDWAASVKLIDGSAFGGQKLITRGEVCQMMDAYGKLVGKDYSNLFKGNESGDLMLDKTLTRCELAQVLMNAQA